MNGLLGVESRISTMIKADTWKTYIALAKGGVPDADPSHECFTGAGISMVGLTRHAGRK